jgi:hypothetical protein
MNSGLNTLAKDLIPLFVKTMIELQVPDYNGVENIPILGNIDYTLSNMKFTKVEVGDIMLGTSPPNVVSVAVKNVNFGITLNWATQQENWPHTKAHGDATVSTSNTQASSEIYVTLLNGRPKFEVKTIGISLGNLKVDIGGGATGWILNLLETLFNSLIKKYVELQVQQQITISINERLNAIIQSTDFIVPLPDSKFALDLFLPEAVGFGTSLLQGGLRFEFLPASTLERCPFTPVDLPNSPFSFQGFQGYISDFVLNSAGFTAVKTGMLNLNVTPDMVPETSPVKLNTTSLKYMLPILYEKFPNQGVALSIVSTQNPNVKFTPASILASHTVDILFKVINADQTETPAFILNAKFFGAMSSLGVVPTGVSKLNITGVIADFDVNMQLEKSFVGDFNTANLNNLVRILLKNGYIANYNRTLQQGMPIVLPSEAGLLVSNPEIVFHEGYIAVAANVDYASGSHFFKFDRLAKQTAAQRVLNRVKVLENEFAELAKEMKMMMDYIN